MWLTVLGGEVWAGHIANVRPDGTRYETTTTLSPVRDDQGRIVFVVATSRDTTRETELEAQLRHAQRMEAVGVLAGGIAHDFNNILMPILGYAELAQGLARGNAQMMTYLDAIFSAGKRAGELVQQILTFSRQTEQVKQPVKFQLILKEALKLLRAAIPATIDIRTRIEEKDAKVLGDPSQLHQVVMNLCTNAFHAMRERGGVLAVTLDAVVFERPQTILGDTLPEGHYLRLQVSDTGHGMDEATRKKIFLPFFTTKKVGEGTGLGLSIVHGIVMGLGGCLDVESEPGQGTTFTVYLPLLRGPGEESVKVQVQPPPGRERILVVDDEAAIGEMLKSALTLFGYRVVALTSSVEAMAALWAAPDHYDLVLSDLTMPEQTGLDLAEAVRQIRPGMPVILMSGFSEGLDAATLEAKGVAAMVQKPVSLTDLASLVHETLLAQPQA
jgi:signal transduction histidine kinase/ActR/RegA family two-component response regulator